MSKSIDPKSFIIGVLSAIVVCMAMGADSDEPKKKYDFGPPPHRPETYKNWDHSQKWEVMAEHQNSNLNKGWEPFAVTVKDSQYLVWSRKPTTW